MPAISDALSYFYISKAPAASKRSRIFQTCKLEESLPQESKVVGNRERLNSSQRNKQECT